MKRGRSLGRLMIPVVVLASLAVPSTVSAECQGAWTPMPSFTKVASTADRIIIGTVLEDPTLGPDEEGGVFMTYVLRIDEVLRGPDPGDTMLIDRVPTRAPITSPCGGGSIYARQGDTIAIAFGGRLPGVDRRGNAAAWIDGEPDPLAVPQAETLTVARVRGIAATLPDTSTSASGPATIDQAGGTAAVSRSSFVLR